MAKIHTICVCAARCAASTCVRPGVLPEACAARKHGVLGVLGVLGERCYLL